MSAFITAFAVVYLFSISIVLVAVGALALHLFIEVKAMQRSTHQIMMIDPMSQQFNSLTDEDKKKISSDPFSTLN